MRFSILRHQQERPFRIPGDWTVIVYTPDGDDYRVIESLCFDEMLGSVARVLMTGWEAWRGESSIDREPSPVEWQLDIELVSGRWARDWNLFTIHCGDKFIGQLTNDETLGFIAAYCLTDGAMQLFSGLQTYEQWHAANHRWLQAPAALLEHVS